MIAGPVILHRQKLVRVRTAIEQALVLGTHASQRIAAAMAVEAGHPRPIQPAAEARAHIRKNRKVRGTGKLRRASCARVRPRAGSGAERPGLRGTARDPSGV
ncbi:MAG: hypothetical protein Fur0039_27090 [Rhodocyclaceae bacterium]